MYLHIQYYINSMGISCTIFGKIPILVVAMASYTIFIILNSFCIICYIIRRKERTLFFIFLLFFLFSEAYQFIWKFFEFFSLIGKMLFFFLLFVFPTYIDNRKIDAHTQSHTFWYLYSRGERQTAMYLFLTFP